jgi:hypothetical protein
MKGRPDATAGGSPPGRSSDGRLAATGRSHERWRSAAFLIRISSTLRTEVRAALC